MVAYLFFVKVFFTNIARKTNIKKGG